MCKLKGIHRDRFSDVISKVLTASVKRHVCVILGEIIQYYVLTAIPTQSPPSNFPTPSKTLPDPTSNSTDPLPWSWRPPDLSAGSLFYNERVCNLQRAVELLGTGYEHLFDEDLKILSLCRLNHGEDGPTYLTITWWEWPYLR